jgi:hypothetical protein
LYNSNISEINAVDASAVYSDWNDWVETLEAMVNYESQGWNTITFSLPDTDTSNNPGDHSDHRHTSLAMQAVADNNACINLVLYEEYVTSGKAVNVSSNDLLAEAGTWDSTHNGWIGKSYSRTIDATGCPTNMENFALSATTSASSENTNTQQMSDKATDDIIDGYPGDYTLETMRGWLLCPMGCDYAQGYYLSRPMPESDLLNGLKKGVNKYN